MVFLIHLFATFLTQKSYLRVLLSCLLNAQCSQKKRERERCQKTSQILYILNLNNIFGNLTSELLHCPFLWEKKKRFLSYNSLTVQNMDIHVVQLVLVNFV